MKCEMCGNDSKLRKVKVEGAVLNLCKGCQGTGEVMGTSKSKKRKSSSKKRRSKKKKRKPRSQQKFLVKGFEKKVKEAREDKGLKIEELAERIKVKESVVHRIESGKLKPDEKLARKLKKVLGVNLYREESVVDYETTKKDFSGSGATIGDIAKVKRKD